MKCNKKECLLKGDKMNIKLLMKGIRSRIYHPILFLKIKMGKDCIIGKRGNYLNPSHVTFGDRVTIGTDTRISCYRLFYDNQVLDPKLYVGNSVTIGSRCSILCADTVMIGNHALIASDVVITSEDHGIEVEVEQSYAIQRLSHAPVIIGDETWIGEKVVILKGVTIGNRSIIGAGSIVTRDVPPYCIAVGNPARVIKKYNFETHTWETWKDER